MLLGFYIGFASFYALDVTLLLQSSSTTDISSTRSKSLCDLKSSSFVMSMLIFCDCSLSKLKDYREGLSLSRMGFMLLERFRKLLGSFWLINYWWSSSAKILSLGCDESVTIATEGLGLLSSSKC